MLHAFGHPATTCCDMLRVENRTSAHAQAQHCCTNLAKRLQHHATSPNVAWKIWPVSNLSQQHPTYRNTSQQSGHTHATCCTQQCCDMLRWNAVIVWPHGRRVRLALYTRRSRFRPFVPSKNVRKRPFCSLKEEYTTKRQATSSPPFHLGFSGRGNYIHLTVDFRLSRKIVYNISYELGLFPVPKDGGRKIVDDHAQSDVLLGQSQGSWWNTSCLTVKN